MPDCNKRDNGIRKSIVSVVDGENNNCNDFAEMSSSQNQRNTIEMKGTNQDVRENRKRKLPNVTSVMSNCIYVSNIPFDACWQEFYDVFAREVGDVVYCSLNTNENGESLGYGTITFGNPESVHLAMEKMDGFELKNRKLVVHDYPIYDISTECDYPTKKPRLAKTICPKFEPNKSDISMDYNSENYGVSQEFLHYWNIIPPLVCRVYITNLDLRVDENKLREVFKLAGKVVNVELQTATDGSKKFGKVEYEHPVESVQAISMLHHQFVYDRRMNVRMDRSGECFTGSIILPEGLKGVGMGLGTDGTPLTNISQLVKDYERPPIMELMAAMISDQAFLKMARKLSEHFSQLSHQLDYKVQEKIKLLDCQFAQQKLELQKIVKSSMPNLIQSVNGNAIGQRRGMNVGRVTNEDVSSRRVGAYFSGSNRVGHKGVVGGTNVEENVRQHGTSMGVAAKRLQKSFGFGTAYNAGNVNTISGGAVFVNRNEPPQLEESSNWIVVRNLPANVTWKMLRDKFQEVGSVRYVEMRENHAKIRFNTVEDANQAIVRFDLSRYNGKILDVRFL